MSTTTQTPRKYRATERTIDDKQFLYEQYWGNLRSTTQIAAMDEVGVSREVVREQLVTFGIPRRSPQVHLDGRLPPWFGYRHPNNETTGVDWSGRR